MFAGLVTHDLRANPDDPCGGGEEAARPSRPAKDKLGGDMNRRDDREEQQQSRDAKQGSGVQSNSLNVRD